MTSNSVTDHRMSRVQYRCSESILSWMTWKCGVWCVGGRACSQSHHTACCVRTQTKLVPTTNTDPRITTLQRTAIFSLVAHSLKDGCGVWIRLAAGVCDVLLILGCSAVGLYSSIQSFLYVFVYIGENSVVYITVAALHQTDRRTHSDFPSQKPSVNI